MATKKNSVSLRGISLSTNGKGLWSRAKKEVKPTVAKLAYLAEEDGYGELRVYFTRGSWDVDTDGLIYTDPGFLKALRAALVERVGLTPAAAREVDYTEQGMQGSDFVSLDVGKKFLKEWL